MMKLTKLILSLLLLLPIASCSSDDEPGTNESSTNNDSKVTVYANGTTSTGVVFSSINSFSFSLNHIDYHIYNDYYLLIDGANKEALKGDVRPYASVTMDGLTYQTLEIREDAFSNCDKITSISIPNTVEILYGSAFEGCDNLKTVSIPASTHVVFPIEGGVTKINLDPQNQEYIETDGLILSKDMETLYAACGKTEVVIPSTVKHIYKGAFKYSPDLLKLTIPNSVKTMDFTSLRSNDKITDIYSDSETKVINTWSWMDIKASFHKKVYRLATLHVTDRSANKNRTWWHTAEPWCYFENIVVDYNP